MNNPLVSFNILTYNRKNELAKTLGKIKEQNYKNYEIIVVDNNSSDGTEEMIKSNYKDIRYIRMNTNVGVSAWNEGFKVAKGEFVFVLDDDSYPLKTSIHEGLNYMSNHPKCGVLGYNVFNKLKQKSQTEAFPPKAWLFVGCGAMIRREVIENVGYFDTNYFIYLHEMDYAIRVYDAGFTVDYAKELSLIHDQSLLSRGKNTRDPDTSHYIFYYTYLSFITFLVLRFDKKYALIYGIKYSLNRFIICFRYYYFFHFFKALAVNFFAIPRLLKQRKPVSREVQKFYNNGSTYLIDRMFFPNFRK
ncbi:MAG: glycosyltransferase [Chlorobi bacterium OLB4]|jgi:Predicted glycosyltransferases|nr:MAG: glycosyltransferase [Chlorobi bacterium OLB4]MBW7856411.1 glycosyltransferase family 2 protein [Ignavibacteria bacterium]OQY78736.1 MAG: hypothetical protein B6D43_01790 [Ignavibacteriales bacterium UTCHB1]